MQLNDRLAKDMKKKENLRRFEDDEEETMTYQERRPLISLNTAPDVFDSKLSHGINNDKNIFDRTAVFQTNEQEDQTW